MMMWKIVRVSKVSVLYIYKLLLYFSFIELYIFRHLNDVYYLNYYKMIKLLYVPQFLKL